MTHKRLEDHLNLNSKTRQAQDPRVNGPFPQLMIDRQGSISSTDQRLDLPY